MDNRVSNPAFNTPEGTEMFDAALIRGIVLGYQRGELAKQLKVSVAVVDRHLDRMLDVLRKEAEQDIKTHYGRELQHLFMIRQEAWDAWEKSKRKKIRTKLSAKRSTRTKRDGVDIDPEDLMVPATQEHTEIETDGDPRFLNVASQTTSAIIKLVGIEKAVTLMNQVNLININEAAGDFDERYKRFLDQYDGEEPPGEVIDTQGTSLPRDNGFPKQLGPQKTDPNPEAS